MKIQTKYLGEVEIEENKIINFQSGLPGFQEENEFVLLDIPNNQLLQILQSVRTTNTAFIVANPHDFYHGYTFNLDDTILKTLQIKNEKDVVVLSIMTIQEPFANSTINLKAPIVINASKKYGKQCILNEDTLPLKANISLPTNVERGD